MEASDLQGNIELQHMLDVQFCYPGNYIMISSYMAYFFSQHFRISFFPLCRTICDSLLVGFKVLTSGQPAE